MTAVRQIASVRRGVAPLFVVLLGFCGPAQADICTVPGTHMTIQAAIDAPVCSEIQLGSQTYEESVFISRSLTLAGPGGGGAILEGLLQARGAGVVATVNHLRVENGCVGDGVRVSGGAELAGLGFAVIQSSGAACPPSMIFVDGFESGDVSAWN